MFYGGEILDNTYEIMEEIGTGGTGVVYRAYHRRLKKYVVVKKLKHAVMSRDKLRIEVDILKGLHHTSLPQVYDFLETGGEVYTIMDYIEGEDLQRCLDRGCRFKEKQLLVWLKQLCEVLVYLHSQKPPILHSDIKPGNIMITPEGNVCLIDFNISLGGEHGEDILGLSQWYAAPEQYEKARLRMENRNASGIVLDGRMDIYSLGASFYSLMSGLLPDIEAPDFQFLHEMELGYSRAFISIIEKAMERQPGKRYKDAAAMKKALEYMYKMDAGYKRLQKQEWLLWGVCGLCIVAGILSCTYGWKHICRQSYGNAYKVFYESAQRYENEDIIRLGIEILNEEKYQEILKKNPEDKAEILYMLGNVYYGQEEYEEAEEYYREAAEEMPVSRYYRDEIMAAVKGGHTERAKEILEEAEQAGLEDEELRLAKQETAYAEGNTAEVIQISQELKNSKSREIAAYSSLMAAKACSTEKLFDRQAEYLEYAYRIGKDKRCLRELGGAYLEAAEHVGEAAARGYLRRAGECYEKLQKSYAVSYRDQMNLAIIRERLGEYKEAVRILKTLETEYQEEYEVYMHLAYISMKEEETKEPEDRDYSRGVNYYKKAERKYQNAGSPPDTAMTELAEYINNLERGR